MPKIEFPALSGLAKASDLLPPGYGSGAGEGDKQGRGASDAPALPVDPTYWEVFGAAMDASAITFTLAQIPHGAILWIQDEMSMIEMGMPTLSMSRYGHDLEELLFVKAKNADDVLWAMMEGLSCTSLTAVVGEIYGDPKALDFVATKRLLHRAEQQGIHAATIRWAANVSLSAARLRWRVTSLPSGPCLYDPQSIGEPRWRAELFRAQGRAPGVWQAEYDWDAARVRLDRLPRASQRQPVPDEDEMTF
ncbi:MAG: hypothetical protein V2J26_01685 [Pacificimonas sp.]|jgi:protein ImuA|nr:hypothetical protein [Pacificimonas sp.]